MPELSREQEKITEALAERFGGAKVLPLRMRGSSPVIAIGWVEKKVGYRWVDAKAVPIIKGEPAPDARWWLVPLSPAAPLGWPHGLRLATEQQIADAHEQQAIRELLAAAGLTPEPEAKP